MKYEVTYACGHMEEVRLYGAVRDRDRKLEWLKTQLCHDCYKKKVAAERAEKAAEAAKEAKENGLPALTGTPKQVEWALRIRKSFLDKLHEQLYEIRFSFENLTDEDKSRIERHFQQITEASWFIEHQDDGVKYLAETWWDKYQDSPDVIVPEEIIKAAREEATVYPAEQKTKIVAELIPVLGRLEIKSLKDSIIIDVLKSHGCRWDSSCSRWYHKIDEVSGPIEDRMAEIGNALLLAGAPILIQNQKIRQNAIDGKFEPKCSRWILYGNDKQVRIWWDFRDDMYDQARKLPHSMYKDNAVYVNAVYYKELRDFVNLYGFKISEDAEKVLKTAEIKDQAVSRVNPVAVANGGEKDGLTDILKSSRDILDDLKDE